MTGTGAADRRGRMLGALLGVHAGDSLGASLEFLTWEQVQAEHPRGLREIVGGGPFDWPAGAATDDTDLTRAVLLAHLDPGDDVVRTAADRMVAWYTGDWPGRAPGSRPRDVGAATADGLEAYLRSGDPRRAGAGAGRAGNGSLMRCLPTALAVPERPRRLVLSAEISAVTHDDPRCTAACGVYNEVVAALLDGLSPAEAVRAGERTARELGDVHVVSALAHAGALDLVRAAATGRTGLPDGARGYVLDSLTLAVAALLDPRPLEDVLVDVVRLGGDTDTNGAIAGGLLGARDGVEAVPARWVATLQFAEEFPDAVDRLVGR